MRISALSALAFFASVALSGNAALAAPASNGGWYLTSGLFQDGGNEYVWTHKPVPSALEVGAGTTAGMTGSQAVFVRGNAELKGIIRLHAAETESRDSFIRYGGLERMVSLEAWRGQRLRLTVRIKNEGDARAYASVQLNKSNNGSIRTLSQRNAPGSLAWEAHQFVLDVPDNATDLAINVGFSGKGAVWLDGIALEAVSQQVALTESRRADASGPEYFLNGARNRLTYGRVVPMPGPEAANSQHAS